MLSICTLCLYICISIVFFFMESHGVMHRHMLKTTVDISSVDMSSLCFTYSECDFDGTVTHYTLKYLGSRTVHRPFEGHVLKLKKGNSDHVFDNSHCAIVTRANKHQFASDFMLFSAIYQNLSASEKSG